MAMKKRKTKKKITKKTKRTPARATRKATSKKAAPKKVKTAKKTKLTKKKAKPLKAKKAKASARRNREFGEGNYKASKRFDKSEAAFVKANKSKIAAMGKAAESALDGPEGDSLRAAEAQAASHGRR